MIDNDLFFISNSFNKELLRNKTFLITGGYGTLLTYLVWELLFLNKMYKLNIKIILLCNNVHKAETRYWQYRGDESLIYILDNLMTPINITDNIDYIIHGAGYASSKAFINNPIETITPNTIGTYNLLELARKKQVKTFMYVSSAAVYGRPDKEIVDENYMGRNDFTVVENCYPTSKQMGENLCLSFNRTYNIPIKIIRPSHNYGITLDLKTDDRLMARFFDSIIHNKVFEISGRGRAKRSIIYIADTMAAIFLILIKGQDNIYNISDTTNYININQLIKRSKQKITTKFVNDKEKHNNFLAYPRNLFKLGWSCKYNLTHTIDFVRRELSCFT
jgi:nucleoside-diphosphate-sugar epimerase